MKFTYFTTVVTAIFMFIGLPAAQANTFWQVTEITDDFNDVIGKGLVTNPVEPKKELTPPYDGESANLFVSCDGVIKIQFTSVNLVDGEFDMSTDALDKLYDFRGRLNHEQKVSFKVRQLVGMEEVTVENQTQFQNWLSTNSTLEVVVPWYGQGNVVFEFPLNGYSQVRQNVCQ